jgi:gamma-glutamylcysteine synthetase
MHDTNKPATEAVAEMGQELEVLENNVMKVAREISEHFQWKKIVEKVDQESEDLNKKMVEYADALRSMSCLPFDAKEVEVQQSYWKKMAHEIGVCVM